MPLLLEQWPNWYWLGLLIVAQRIQDATKIDVVHVLEKKTVLGSSFEFALALFADAFAV